MRRALSSDRCWTKNGLRLPVDEMSEVVSRGRKIIWFGAELAEV